MKTIDSFRPPERSEKRPSPTPMQGSGARFTKLASTPRRRNAWGIVIAVVASLLLLPLAMVGLLGVGVVVIYGIVALIRRVPSRITFLLALAALIYMVLLQLTDTDSIAQSMAVLAYILLAIGAISLAKEVKMSNRMWFKKH
jgi:hypothetical protein